MNLKNDPPTVESIRQSHADLMLGIIHTDGKVGLIVSDPLFVPGHAEWVSKCGIQSVYRGFSMLIRDGKVWALFPRSRLNPGPDARLEQEFIDGLVEILPINEPLNVLE